MARVGLLTSLVETLAATPQPSHAALPLLCQFAQSLRRHPSAAHGPPSGRSSSSTAAMAPASSSQQLAPEGLTAGQQGLGSSTSPSGMGLGADGGGSGPSSSGRGGERTGRGPQDAPTGRIITTTAPWPFIDPLRPMILPAYVSPTTYTRVLPTAVDLPAAINKVKANSAARVQGTERDRLSGRKRNQVVFDETIEFIANLAIVRGVVQLPHGTGKTVVICVFASGAEAEAAKQAGADIIGDEALIQDIIESGGKSVPFDKLIATPEFMKPLARAGKVLGPKGLMPNVKLGTLTSDVVTALTDMRRGRLDFKIDREGIIHVALGKISFPDQHLVQNIAAFLAALLELRPASLEGTGVQGYIKRAYIKSSMTPSVPVSLESCETTAQVVLAAKAAARAAEEQNKDAGKA